MGPRFFSQTNFAPAYRKLFNSVMSFVEIFVNNSFTFTVSDLTVLQSWFLREGNVVFFSVMFFQMVSMLDWVSTCICVWFGVYEFCVFMCVGYCGSFFYVFAYLFVGSFLYFKFRKSTILCYCPNLVSDLLVCWFKSAKFRPDFYHSFSILTFSRVASKITI